MIATYRYFERVIIDKQEVIEFEMIDGMWPGERMIYKARERGLYYKRNDKWVLLKAYQREPKFLTRAKKERTLEANPK